MGQSRLRTSQVWALVRPWAAAWASPARQCSAQSSRVSGGQQPADQLHGVIPQQTVGLAVGAVVDAAAGRVGGIAGDAGGPQRGGVAEHDVPADPVQQKRMIGAEGVQVGAGGQGVGAFEQVLVPAVAVHRPAGGQAAALQEIGAAAGQLGGAAHPEQVDGGQPPAHVQKMQVTVIEAGQHDPALQVHPGQGGGQGVGVPAGQHRPHPPVPDPDPARPRRQSREPAVDKQDFPLFLHDRPSFCIP